MGAEVYFNGAFFTGVGLDSSELLTGDYERAQQAVCAAIGGAADEWRYDRITDGPSRLRFSVKGKYASLIPVSFVSRAGPATRQDLERRLAEPDSLGGEALAAWQRLGLTITDMRIDMFDAGVGIVAVRGSVGQAKIPMADLRADVEEVSSGLVATLNETVVGTIAEFARAVRDAIPAAVLDVPWFQEEGSVSGSRRDGTPAARPLGLTPPGQLLWLHRTYIFDTSSHEGEDGTALEELLPSTYLRASWRNVHFLPGIGSTVIACRERSDANAIGLLSVRDILALMDLQWAYIAAAMEIDRTLFRRLHQFAVNARRARSSDLEREAQTVLALYDRVRLFRAAGNSVIIDLGGGSRGHWDLMARVQSLPEIFEAIDDKLSALQDACESLRAHVATRQQRRIARTIEVFAGFSVVASVAGIATFITNPDLSPTTWNRILGVLIVLLLVTGALLANWFAHSTLGRRQWRWRRSARGA